VKNQEGEGGHEGGLQERGGVRGKERTSKGQRDWKLQLITGKGDVDRGGSREKPGSGQNRVKKKKDVLT